MSSPSASRPSLDLKDAWGWAVQLIQVWSGSDRRIDWLLDDLPAAMPAGVRAHVQQQVLGTLRHLGRIDAVLEPRIQRPPRPWIGAALRVTAFEMLIEPTEEKLAKAVHFLVERVRRATSAGEAKFANALGRHLARELAKPLAAPTSSDATPVWAEFYSHPAWLIDRWREHWGDDTTQQLLAINQTPAAVALRWRATDPAPDWLEVVAKAPGYYRVPAGAWTKLRPLLDEGSAQIQDPATRHAIEVLGPAAGETLLDLCASPGGKSLALADEMKTGKIISVDLPGRRQRRLQENLARFPAGVSGVAVAADILKGLRRAFAESGLPETYDGVLVDVPCSNTGVMRHRVDVRWRLNPDSFRRHARQQLDLLQAAADRVSTGGRLVYSTCSIDREENEQLVQAFVRRSRGGFELEESRIILPGKSDHDGAAVFRLRRVAAN